MRQAKVCVLEHVPKSKFWKAKVPEYKRRFSKKARLIITATRACTCYHKRQHAKEALKARIQQDRAKYIAPSLIINCLQLQKPSKCSHQNMPQTNQHDIVVKRVLSEKKYAIDLLQNTLDKAIADKLDFTKLKMEQGSFIDAKDRERFTDLLFSIPHKQEGKYWHLCILIEHKSHPEKTEVLRQLLSLSCCNLPEYKSNPAVS